LLSFLYNILCKVLIIAVCISLSPRPVCAKTCKLHPAEDKVQYINIDWWKRFNDELLVEYLIAAVNNNYSLKSAGAKIKELQQDKNVETSKLFPSLSVGANYLGVKIPRTAIPFQGFRDNSFALPFIVNWEADLFLKRKNKIDMAQESVNAAIYREQAASISLAAEAAGLYFNITNLNEQIRMQNEVIKNKEEKLKRAQKSFGAGVFNAVDLNSASKELEFEKTVLNDYKKQKEGFLYRLIYLISGNFDDKGDYKFSDINKIEFTGEIPTCLNSRVTLYRPDILEKEAYLKKAKIDITLARKAFLPNINVFGVLVFSTLTPNFGWDGAVANLLAGATQNIFSGGKRIFDIKRKKAAYKEALYDYLDTDINALKELNECLYNLHKDIETYKFNVKNFDFEEDNFIRVSNSYKHGVSNRIDVLDKRNNYLYEKSRMLNSKVQKFADLISLYKAAGGRL